MDIWKEEFDIMENSCGGDDIAFLHAWNRNVIPWMEQRGVEYKRIAHAYATNRGMRFDAATHRYVYDWEVKELKDARLTKAAWCHGNLRIRLNDSTYVYREVPHEVFANLALTWSPMKYYASKIKGKYK